jgi:hypothetical protein
MKWFKHDADARNSLKLRKVRRKYGADGYAIYWFCLEAIAYEVDKDNLSFDLKEDAETIAFELSIQEKRVEEIMHYLVEAGLFESSQGVVTCLKLAERLDKSMTNSPKMRKWLESKSVMTLTDDVTTTAGDVKTCAELDKIRLDQTREEKKLKDFERKELIDSAFNYLWSNMKLTKKAKSVAEKSFIKSVKKVEDPMHFAKFLVTDTETRFKNQQIGFDKMNPSTYLNQSRWEDDHTIDKPTNQKVVNDDNDDWERFDKETF